MQRSETDEIILDIGKNSFGGIAHAIASKSYAHRMLIAAAFSDRETCIRLNTSSEDIKATAGCLRALGAGIIEEEELIRVTPVGRISRGGAEEAAHGEAFLDAGESGSTLRFLLPVIGALGRKTEIRMHGRLGDRPLSPLKEELISHGMSIEKSGDLLRLSGRLSGGDYIIAGDVSSQYITGLLLMLPLIQGGVRIIASGRLQSRPYIDITISVLNMFGIEIDEEDMTIGGERCTVFSRKEGAGAPGYLSPGEVTVPGDWSNAAFLLCAGALSDGVTMTGLDSASKQGDRRILDILKDFGADVTVIKESDEGLGAEGVGTREIIRVAKGPLKGVRVDVGDIPDLAPVICCVAAFAQGTSVLTNIERLRIKESDRVVTTIDALSGLGAEIYEDIVRTADGGEEKAIIVKGKPSLTGGSADSYNDHRIAMMAAVASVGCIGPVTIKGSGAVRKSYPGFYEDFLSLVKKD